MKETYKILVEYSRDTADDLDLIHGRRDRDPEPKSLGHYAKEQLKCELDLAAELGAVAGTFEVKSCSLVEDAELSKAEAFEKKHPTLLRWNDVGEESLHVRCFAEWLLKEYDVEYGALRRKNTKLVESLDRTIYRYFEIDEKRLEQERRELIADVAAQQRSAP